MERRRSQIIPRTPSPGGTSSCSIFRCMHDGSNRCEGSVFMFLLPVRGALSMIQLLFFTLYKISSPCQLSFLLPIHITAMQCRLTVLLPLQEIPGACRLVVSKLTYFLPSPSLEAKSRPLQDMPSLCQQPTF